MQSNDYLLVLISKVPMNSFGCLFCRAIARYGSTVLKITSLLRLVL